MNDEWKRLIKQYNDVVEGVNEIVQEEYSDEERLQIYNRFHSTKSSNIDDFWTWWNQLSGEKIITMIDLGVINLDIHRG